MFLLNIILLKVKKNSKFSFHIIVLMFAQNAAHFFNKSCSFLYLFNTFNFFEQEYIHMRLAIFAHPRTEAQTERKKKYLN